MDDFDTLFPGFKAGVQELHEGLLVFAFFALVLGLLLAAYRGMFGNLAEIVRALVAVAILSVTLSFIDDWTFELGNLVNEHVIERLDTDPREAHTRFGELIVNPVDDGEDEGWWDKIFDAKAATATWIGKLLILVAAKIAWLIVWWAYFLHKALVYFGVALAPIFLPMLMLNATRGIAVRYLLGLFSLTLWPLGWAVANLMTEALMEAAADRTLFDYGGVVGQASFGPQMIFFMLLASMWLLASTIGAPIVMSRVLTSGAQIGAALLGGFAGAGVGSVAGGVGGAMLGGGIAGPVGAAAGGLGGAGAGFASGAVGGPGSGMATGAGMAAFSMAGGVSSKGSGDSASSSGGGGEGRSADSAGSGNGGNSSGNGGGSGKPANYSAEAEAIAAKAGSS